MESTNIEHDGDLNEYEEYYDENEPEGEFEGQDSPYQPQVEYIQRHEIFEGDESYDENEIEGVDDYYHSNENYFENRGPSRKSISVEKKVIEPSGPRWTRPEVKGKVKIFSLKTDFNSFRQKLW